MVYTLSRLVAAGGIALTTLFYSPSCDNIISFSPSPISTQQRQKLDDNFVRDLTHLVSRAYNLDLHSPSSFSFLEASLVTLAQNHHISITSIEQLNQEYFQRCDPPHYFFAGMQISDDHKQPTLLLAPINYSSVSVAHIEGFDIPYSFFRLGDPIIDLYSDTLEGKATIGATIPSGDVLFFESHARKRAQLIYDAVSTVSAARKSPFFSESILSDSPEISLLYSEYGTIFASLHTSFPAPLAYSKFLDFIISVQFRCAKPHEEFHLYARKLRQNGVKTYSPDEEEALARLYEVVSGGNSPSLALSELFYPPSFGHSLAYPLFDRLKVDLSDFLSRREQFNFHRLTFPTPSPGNPNPIGKLPHSVLVEWAHDTYNKMK